MGAPLAFAGLWETWTGPNGEELDTVAIVTTEANRTLRDLHDRMPVIVPPDAFDLWLDTRAVDDVAACALIRPAPDDLLEVWPVSTRVNRAANDDPKLIEPVAVAATPRPADETRKKRKNSPAGQADDGQGFLF